jgi:sodium/potassium-transporting ATPase subunit alpha
MTVMDLWLNGSMWYAGTPNTLPKEQKLLKLDVSGVAQLMHVCVTCSKYDFAYRRAKYDRTDVSLDKRSVIGDATEAGLLKFAGNRLNNIDRV